MNPHPRFARFRTAVTTAPRIRWSGDCYRFIRPKYDKTRALISGAGALRAGGRWNHMGVCTAVYLSLDPQAAIAEVMSHCDREGLPFAKGVQRNLRAIHVEVSEVLELTDPTVLASFGVSTADLVDIWGSPWEISQDRGDEALTQAIGRAAFTEGFEAILAPCAPDPTLRNLVVFNANLRPGSSLKVIRRRR